MRNSFVTPHFAENLAILSAEYPNTCPATEFERLGGKGSAKKWRQSLRLVGKHAVTPRDDGKMAEDDWCANRRGLCRETY